jgi:hypothetical protein
VPQLVTPPGPMQEFVQDDVQLQEQEGIACAPATLRRTNTENANRIFDRILISSIQ